MGVFIVVGPSAMLLIACVKRRVLDLVELPTKRDFLPFFSDTASGGGSDSTLQ